MSPEKPSTEQKIDRMRDAYRGFERGALEVFLNIIRDDAVWHSQLTGTDLTGKAVILLRWRDYLRPRMSTGLTSMTSSPTKST